MPLAPSYAPIIGSLFILLSCKLVLALPITSSSVSEVEKLLTTDTGLERPSQINPSVLGGFPVVGVGILFIVIRYTMPKIMKEKRLDREYKLSPKETRHMHIHVQSSSEQEKEKDVDKQKSANTVGGDINKIWIDAIQKGPGLEAYENVHNAGGAGDIQIRSPNEKQWELKPVNQSFTLSRNFSHHLTLPPIISNDQQLTRESHNFGENPNYHDEAFQYNSMYSTSSISTPPSPFSSRFYSVNIRKVKGHKRSRSSPLSSQYQTLQAVGLQNDASPMPHFPLPTLRPVTPPENASTPNSPLLISNDSDLMDSTTIYRYTKQYSTTPEAHLQDSRQVQSVDSLENVPKSTMALSVVEGARWSNDVDGDGRNGTFQPVMIFEQGQSVTGQKWKRKVTVFRSDVLQRLEQGGLVLH